MRSWVKRAHDTADNSCFLGCGKVIEYDKFSSSSIIISPCTSGSSSPEISIALVLYSRKLAMDTRMFTQLSPLLRETKGLSALTRVRRNNNFLTTFQRDESFSTCDL